MEELENAHQQSFLIGLCGNASLESAGEENNRMRSILFDIDWYHENVPPSSRETCCLSRGTPERFEHVAFWNEKDSLENLEEAAIVEFEAIKCRNRRDRMDRAWEQPEARPKPPRF